MSGGISFVDVSGKADTVLTTKGDIATWDTKRVRKGVSATNYTGLQADSAIADGLTYGATSRSTMTGTADMIYSSSANTLSRLAVGSARQVLQTNSATNALEWSNSPQSLMGTTGDILSASGANTLSVISPSTSGDVLTSNGAGVLPTFQTAGGGGTFVKAGSDISTTYVSDLEVTGITASDVYQIIYYISDDANPTGENCEPKLQRNGGGSTYDDAQSIFTGTSESQYGNSNADQWTLGKVSNKHSWAGVVYVWSYNGNFSNSYQDGTVMRGMTMTTAWNGTDTMGQNDATTDITSFKLSMMMADDTVIDCNGSLQVNTFDYST